VTSAGRARVSGLGTARPAAERVARHPAAWRFLLPRSVDGPVVLADLEPVTTQNLLRSYPAALVLGRSVAELAGFANAAIWDGSHPPLRPGRAALLVCDDRRGQCAAALAPMVRDAGVRVAIVPSARPYSFALFPTPEQLRAVIARGWPVIYDGQPRRWMGYWLATTTAWRYLGRAGLAMSHRGDSVIDLVLGQVGHALSGRAELCGLIAGRGLGQATLRARCAGAELAVRVAVSPDSVRRLANHQRAVTDMAARLGASQRIITFPDVVASGSTDDIAWAAERWIRAPAMRSARRWRPASGSGWTILQAIAAAIADCSPTGHTAAGWSNGWLTALDAVAPGLREHVRSALAPIEAAGMKTAWCHGDLWPGNVFLRRPPVVIDWERARPDAPAGFDGLYAEICRCSLARRCTFGQAAAWLSRPGCGPEAPIEVGGRRFADWGRAERHALLLAAVTHYATGENEGQRPDAWTTSWGEMHILPMMRALGEIG
jgi:hypothetical protein